ncbi:MAG: argininosuccinate lyase, partial [Syntrophales bacterium LBB04]|nr:argininosuccinate lyase [Syntrophales bacterium LBB04]
DTVDTIIASLQILNSMLKRISFNKKKMHMDAAGGFSTATDIAEYLVKRGVPFRAAHGIVGKLVDYCIKKHKTFDSLSKGEYHNFSDKFDDAVYNYLTVESSVNMRSITGGTSKTSVIKRIKAIKRNRKVSPNVA